MRASCDIHTMMDHTVIFVLRLILQRFYFVWFGSASKATATTKIKKFNRIFIEFYMLKGLLRYVFAALVIYFCGSSSNMYYYNRWMLQFSIVNLNIMLFIVMLSFLCIVFFSLSLSPLSTGWHWVYFCQYQKPPKNCVDFLFRLRLFCCCWFW